MKMNSKNRGGWVALAGLLGMLATPALAQQYYDPGVFQLAIPQMTQGYESQGIRLGSFNLAPVVEVGAEWHDNIYYQNQDEVSDTVYHIRPKVTLNSGWTRHALALSASADYARFQDRPSEDYNDLVLSADARIDVQRGKFFTLQAATMSLHEDRGSPDDPGGVTPTDFTLDRYLVGYTHNFNRLTASLSYGRNDTNYDNNVNEDGEFIDNGDRDRTQETLNLRMDYLVAPQRSVLLQLGTIKVSYDLDRDYEDNIRDSDGFDARAGVAFDITGVLTGDLYAHYYEQDYDDPRFSSVDNVGFGAGLSWYPTLLTSVQLRAEHQPLETTQENASSYLASIYSVRVQHELRRWLLLHGRVSYTNNDYKLTADAPDGALTDTQVTRADVGLSYLFNRHVRLTAGYSWEDQDANRAIDRYTASRYFLLLGLEL